MSLRVLASLWLACCWLAAPPALAQSASVGATLRNVATVEYGVGALARRVQTNEVVLRIEPVPSRAAVAVARLAVGGPAEFTATAGPTQCLGASGPVTLAPPRVAGAPPIDPLREEGFAQAAAVHGGDALFVRVVDADQNRDATALDVIEVRVTSAATGDGERLRLTETAVDSGVFVGYVDTAIGTAGVGNCVLEVARDSRVEVRYVDPLDPADAPAATALVDPYGLVFDSATGAAVDGVRVRLVDALSGAPARVFGDDGTSAYPAEVITGEAVTDAGGTVYRLPPGVYRFPLVAPGRYRLEVEPPGGYVFASGVAVEELQRLAGAPFRLGEGSYGRPFEVAAPVAAAIDVPLDRAGESLLLRKTASTAVASAGDFVLYELLVENTSRVAALRPVRIEDRLPVGVRFRPGSSRRDGARIADPSVSAEGRVLTFDLVALAPGERVRLRYVVEVTVAARARELVNTAIARAPGGVQSNEARAVVRLATDLFTDRGFIVGRVSEGSCGASDGPGVPGVRVYLEDGRYALTDAEGKYHFEGVAPGSHVVQIDDHTLPDHLAAGGCADTVRHARQGRSQFVDLRAGALWRADFQLARRTASAQVAPADRPLAGSGRALPSADARGGASGAAASFDIEAEDGSVRWLAPQQDAVLAIPSVKLAVAHGPSQRVTLELAGRPVPALNFEGVTLNAARTAAVSRWRGVDLRDGANVFVAIVSDADGSEAARLTRIVHYGGGAVRAEIDREASSLVADGRSRPVVALRLFDAHGKPARPGTLGAYRVDAPYRSWWEVQALDDNPLLAVGAREPTFEVDADGLARIELEPTSDSGTVVLRLRFSERLTQELRAWLQPAPRPWILVGLAEGTAAWRSVSRALEPLPGDLPIEDGYDGEGRVAFFAKGRVRGDFLLTLAYDSAHDPRAARERLRGVIEPDRYYLVYGDGTEQRFEAASGERVFIKLERREFVALFGDFDTGLTVTELGRYSRSLTGLKADVGGERVLATGFVARTDLGLVRDELRGDGTSGLYRLTRRALVINSDKLRIEVRDRFRSERVLESRELARFLDYRIDYEAGTLYFREPVPSRDARFNPVYIVAEYETRGAGQEVTAAGGRAALRAAGGALEIGASAIHDGALAGDSRLGGIDLKWRATPATEVRLEAAYSESDEPTRGPSGTAWLGEIRHVSQKLDLIAYAREQERSFGTGQQAPSEAGTRKLGADLRWQLGERWAVQGEALQQQMLDTGAERRLAAAELRRQGHDANASFGVRAVEDEDGRGEVRRSEQAYLTGSVDLLEDRATLRASGDLTLRGADSSSDYPARTLLGLDYRLASQATLFIEWEQGTGESLSSEMSRIGVRARPWERTQFVSAVGRQASEFGPRTFANFGLTQGWRLSERWTVDLGLDRSDTLRGAGLAPLDVDVPLASGSLSEDFLATFAGAQYHADLWTATARLERRAADSETRRTLLAGWYREPAVGHALSLTILARDSDARFPEPDTSAADLRFAWAYRPVAGRWIVFNRTDFKRDARRDPTLRAESTRWVQNLHGNLQADAATQFGVQFGARHVTSTFDDERYRGLSTLLAFDVRRDLPWRVLDRALDVGLHGAWLRSWESAIGERQAGIDLGVTVATNAWLSIGWNFVGFRDDDFAGARHTAQGPFLRVRIKADQDTFRDLSLDSLRPAR